MIHIMDTLRPSKSKTLFRAFLKKKKKSTMVSPETSGIEVFLQVVLTVNVKLSVAQGCLFRNGDKRRVPKADVKTFYFINLNKTSINSVQSLYYLFTKAGVLSLQENGRGR